MLRRSEPHRGRVTRARRALFGPCPTEASAIETPRPLEERVVTCELSGLWVQWSRYSTNSTYHDQENTSPCHHPPISSTLRSLSNESRSFRLDNTIESSSVPASQYPFRPAITRRNHVRPTSRIYGHPKGLHQGWITIYHPMHKT